MVVLTTDVAPVTADVTLAMGALFVSVNTAVVVVAGARVSPLAVAPEVKAEESGAET